MGVKLNLIKNSDLTTYAVRFLTNHPETNDLAIIQLAWGDDNLECESLLESILKKLHINDFDLDAEVWEVEKRKWRFGVLACLKLLYQEEFEELLNKIAKVYADFNYPEDMESFINYLPPQDGFDPSQYSKEENVARLINLFNEFLKKERRSLQNEQNI